MTAIIRNKNFFCTKCGSEFVLDYPISIESMNEKTEAFNNLHKDCKQTWTEPEADQSKNVQEKAIWWMTNGELGMSSETMWNCFYGIKDYRICHPSDPDDFSRCWKLLKAVPEWKSELHKLKPLSEAWSNLVDNWDKLTEMYEKNREEHWINCEAIGMYEFMQTLI